MKKIKFKNIIIFVIALFPFLDLWAVPISNYDFNPIVVTGTKTSKTLKDTPVKTEVIDGKRIQEQNYRDVSEAILDVSGITLQSLTGRQGSAAVIQGLSDEHVLVLIDGIPVMQRSSSGVDLTSISTLDIKQIEVIKGGASALYGGQAMGGVINIITKNSNSKSNSSFQIGRDNYFEGNSVDTGYNTLRAHTNGKRGGLSYRLSFTNNKYASVNRNEETFSRDTPDSDKKTITGSVKYKISNAKFINFKLERYTEDTTSYSSKELGNGNHKEVHNISNIKGHSASVVFSHQYNSRLDYKLIFNNESFNDELSLGDDPKTAYNEFLKIAKTKQNRFEIQSNYTLNDDHLFTYGIVHKKNGLDQKSTTAIDNNNSNTTIEIDNKKNNSNEYYFQDDWFLGKSEIISGVRYTKDQYFGDNISPKINYSYSTKLGNLVATYRAAVGTGYRAPSLKERFYLLDHRSFANYIVYGNENLRPETSTSYQMSVDLIRSHYYSLEFGIFKNDIDNLILVKQTETKSSEKTFSYKNINRAKIIGYDIGGSVSLPYGVKLSSSLNYTKAVNATTGNIIPNRPFYTANFNIKKSFLKEKLTVMYLLRHLGESYANENNTVAYKGFQQSDFKLNYKTGGADLSLGVKNIFDVKKDAVTDNNQVIFDQKPALGRTIYTGFQYDI